MFDSRFKKGIVFRIDANAAKEFNLQEGIEFAISRDATSVEIRASRFKDGRPARGRPRKFPTSAVARMLGVTDLATVDSVEDYSNSENFNSAEDEARVSSLIAGTSTASSEDETPW